MFKPFKGKCKDCPEGSENWIEVKAGYCRYHNRLRKGKEILKKVKVKKPTGELAVFKEIWNERAHICTNCKKILGAFSHWFFAHIKGKGAYPELRLEKSNIQLLCKDCHYAFDSQGIEKFNKLKR